MDTHLITCRHGFVDEAGDPTFFGKHGKVIIGEEGCSKYFILGLLKTDDPDYLRGSLTSLRLSLQEDPYFRKVESMLPERKKTALAFHAKDDCPEVRREVMRVLREQPVRFFAAIRSKQDALSRMIQYQQSRPEYRYNPNDLYDHLVKRLFRGRLDTADEYRICFAERKETDRTQALAQALRIAKLRHRQLTGLLSASRIYLRSTVPSKEVGLQAVDYFLWALQRFYERKEDRWIEYLLPRVEEVLDLDDKRLSAGGEAYTQQRPLSLAALDMSKG